MNKNASFHPSAARDGTQLWIDPGQVLDPKHNFPTRHPGANRDPPIKKKHSQIFSIGGLDPPTQLVLDRSGRPMEEE